MIDRTKFITIILYCTLFAFIYGCVGSLDSKPVFKSKGKGQGVYHRVKKGETLWSIAKAYKVNLKRIKKRNRISNANNIKVGTRLFIPGARRVVKVRVSKGKVKKVSLDRRAPSLKKKFFAWPLKGQLTSRYGIRNKRKHDGIDIAAPRGTPIYASASGKVIFSGWGPTGYGKMVIIKHNEKWVSVYAHNSKNMVKKNQTVKKGKKIARVGSTGRSTGPHLHFELREERDPVNPLHHLK